MKDEAIHTIESGATILDRDNQPLSSGQVRLYTTLHSGVFWPHRLEHVLKLQESAATLKTEDGSLYALKNFRPCPGVPSNVVNHCEFDFS